MFDTSVSRAHANAIALSAAQRAAALDSALPDAHLAIATALEYEFRFADALRATERALDLDLGNAQGHTRRAEILLALGRPTNALGAARRAVDLDPLFPLARTNFAYALLASGAPDSAERQVERAVALDSVTPNWWLTLAWVRYHRGRLAEGLRAAEHVVGASPESAELFGAALGKRPREPALRLLTAAAAARPFSAYFTATPQAAVYARLGLPDVVFARLRAAVAERDVAFPSIISSPWFAPYHHDPRWDHVVGATRC